MKGIIIAYPIKSTALQLKSLLEEEGLYVSHICSMGSSVLNIAADLRGGVVVCASILKDMTSAALAENLPPNFDVISISKGGREGYMGNLITMPLPIDRQELVNMAFVLTSSESSFTNRKKDDAEFISDAKSILMSINNMTEMQAHKFLQKESMRLGLKIVDVAKKIIRDMAD